MTPGENDGLKPTYSVPPLTSLCVLSPPSSEKIGRPAASSSPVWQCSWSRDGCVLASCHGAPDSCVRVWKKEWTGNNSDHGGEQEAMRQRWFLAATLRDGHARTVRSVAFAPCSKVLASASFDGTVAVWEKFDDGDSDDNNDGGYGGVGETAGGWECTAQLEGHESEVKCVSWNSTGSLLASCGRDKSVWIWESFLPGTIGDAGDRDPDGGGDGEGEFECIAVLHGHTGDVKCVEFAPSLGQWGDGDEILLSSSYDDTVKCWAEDGGDWYCAATLSAHSSTVWSVAAAAGGTRLVTGSSDRCLAIWRCYTAQEKRRMDPDSKGGDGLWKCVGKLPSAHDGPIYSVHCAPSRAGHGRIASGGADDRIQIYREVPGGTSDAPLFTLDAEADDAHDGDVNCVQWHPKDGSILVSCGDDGLVKIWR
eukprot:CAMPEP_0183309556 /NCGR_PEP_ID=MMETSP0160_2-20130417/25416_1 /TAXON_ID=2839 ORGANISM="Odontella Sinensis, Strain Grunow 1884" /NCGR_SAMPLE_ID=MMETSP0160_2 /ASSEMBLY_ACC=CAM_ASM_000250 /LENGTH=421 /DNA_ID=CAMNT_0025473607 /DNA_START=54 /DNA_END=1316 /DNA_ORIENTATION=-